MTLLWPSCGPLVALLWPSWGPPVREPPEPLTRCPDLQIGFQETVYAIDTNGSAAHAKSAFMLMKQGVAFLGKVMLEGSLISVRVRVRVKLKGALPRPLAPASKLLPSLILMFILMFIHIRIPILIHMLILMLVWILIFSPSESLTLNDTLLRSGTCSKIPSACPPHILLTPDAIPCNPYNAGPPQLQFYNRLTGSTDLVFTAGVTGPSCKGTLPLSPPHPNAEIPRAHALPQVINVHDAERKSLSPRIV